jgi:hypothetical protein
MVNDHNLIVNNCQAFDHHQIQDIFAITIIVVVVIVTVDISSPSKFITIIVFTIFIESSSQDGSLSPIVTIISVIIVVAVACARRSAPPRTAPSKVIVAGQFVCLALGQIRIGPTACSQAPREAHIRRMPDARQQASEETAHRLHLHRAARDSNTEENLSDMTGRGHRRRFALVSRVESPWACGRHREQRALYADCMIQSLTRT